MNRRLFTLLELVLVVAILALMASSALLLADSAEDQARFDATKVRLEELQQVLVGSSQPAFVTDCNTFPQAIDDLLVKPAALRAWAPDPVLGFSWGWRGPYLHTIDPQLLDGWGQPWVVDNTSDPTLYTIISRGRDQLAGGTDPYDADVSLAINKSYTSLSGTINISASLTNFGTTNLAANRNLRLMMLYPHTSLPSSLSNNYNSTTLSPFLSAVTPSGAVLNRNATRTYNFSITIPAGTLINLKQARLIIINESKAGTTISAKSLSPTTSLLPLQPASSSYTVNLPLKP